MLKQNIRLVGLTTSMTKTTQSLLVKVPAVTAFFWIIKVLATTVGETFADFLNTNLNLGLTGTSLVMGTALVFATLLGVTFLIWYRREGTLAMKSIVTKTRESFYWLAILFTFALGTATGDWLAESAGLGYGISTLVYGLVIAAIALAWRRKLIGEITAFWIAYILTRPLGASIGDLLAQSLKDGGLGLGTTTTSVLFLVAILAAVTYLSLTKRDEIRVR